MKVRRLKVKQIGLRSKPEGKNAWYRLPFVGDDHGKHLSYWDVPLTGGYFGGIEAGKIVARLFIKYLRDERDSPLRCGTMNLRAVLSSLDNKKPSTKEEEEALCGQRVGFMSEITYWLEAAAERLGSSFDAIPERSLVAQANEALTPTDTSLIAGIAAGGAQ